MPTAETDDEIAPLVQKVGATSIAEIEKLIGEAASTRNQSAPRALGKQPVAHSPSPCSTGYPGRSRKWLRPHFFGKGTVGTIICGGHSSRLQRTTTRREVSGAGIHGNAGVSRRKVSECMTWAGTGVLYHQPERLRPVDQGSSDRGHGVWYRVIAFRRASAAFCRHISARNDMQCEHGTRCSGSAKAIERFSLGPFSSPEHDGHGP
jgi:hypothetical protein